jgi:hypothetical protein
MEEPRDELYKDFYTSKSKHEANIIKLFAAVIYHHSMAIPSFCVIKLYYLGNYCGMAVIYCSILTLEKIGLKLLR